MPERKLQFTELSERGGRRWFPIPVEASPHGGSSRRHRRRHSSAQ
ncbi:hypothetical protein LINPERPRIM_LOCUS42619 [Linum perenne]